MQKQQQHGHEQQSLLAGPSYEGVLWLLGKASDAFKLKLFNLIIFIFIIIIIIIAFKLKLFFYYIYTGPHLRSFCSNSSFWLMRRQLRLYH